MVGTGNFGRWVLISTRCGLKCVHWGYFTCIVRMENEAFLLLLRFRIQLGV